MTSVQGLGNKGVTGIMVNFLMIFSIIGWWFMAKGTPYRRTIVKLGVCWLIVIITYVLSMPFDIKAVMPITFIAFIAFIYYFVKAWRAERRYKAQHQ